jgi:hypothetical protein
MRRGCGRERIEAVEDAPVRVREEVAVEDERDGDRRVAHVRLEILRMHGITLAPAYSLTMALVERSHGPGRVTVREVGPRDGFQNEPEQIATADKIRLVNAVGRSGLRRIEVTSFVRADVVTAGLFP